MGNDEGCYRCKSSSTNCEEHGRKSVLTISCSMSPLPWPWTTLSVISHLQYDSFTSSPSSIWCQSHLVTGWQRLEHDYLTGSSLSLHHVVREWDISRIHKSSPYPMFLITAMALGANLAVLGTNWCLGNRTSQDTDSWKLKACDRLQRDLPKVRGVE